MIRDALAATPAKAAAGLALHPPGTVVLVAGGYDDLGGGPMHAAGEERSLLARAAEVAARSCVHAALFGPAAPRLAEALAAAGLASIGVHETLAEAAADARARAAPGLTIVFAPWFSTTHGRARGVSEPDRRARDLSTPDEEAAMADRPAQIAATYFDSWKARDFATLRSLLADDCTFAGPLGTADDGDSCLEGLQGLREALDDIVVDTITESGDDAITWFALHLKSGAEVPVANWSHVEDGKIARIRVTFDPRPFLD